VRQSHLLPTFKACGPNGIPMEFFNALIPGKDDSEKSWENNIIEKVVIHHWNNGFLNAIFSLNLEWYILLILKFFM